MRANTLSRRLAGWAALLGFVATSAGAGAQPALREVSVHAPAGQGQPGLSVGFDAGGSLRAAACAAPPCALPQGREIALPAEARALAHTSELSALRLAPGRHAVVVRIADPKRQREWVAVVAAPLGGGPPFVAFEGWTGLVEGEYGLRRGPMVIVSEPDEKGQRQIAIGEQREDIGLCGRPTILAPQLLAAKDMKLHPAKVQRLTEAELERAEALTAERLGDSAGAGGYSILRAVAASSAVGDPKALTDGDPNTTWSENRGGSGRGEFVRMLAPGDLPITGFELVIRPPEAVVEHGAAPRELYIATTDRLLRVRMPEDAWQHPGARYGVTLARPLTTDCVALITESAYSEAPNARVTFAELAARTEFDDSAIEGLVGALAGGGERAQSAASALRAIGRPGFEAVAGAYEQLDEGGRRVALDVMDHAECDQSAPVYVKALLSPHRAHRLHARERLRRCGEVAADLLVQELARGNPRAQPLIAGELSLIDPARAVRSIVPLLTVDDASRRSLLRVALARASRAQEAEPEVRRLLADGSVPARATLDLMRALGDRLPRFQPQASQAFARLARADANFRTRYLLLEPAAQLAPKDRAAADYLQRALAADPSHHIRAGAARAIAYPDQFQAEFLKALDDPQVRVREAAVEALGSGRGVFAAPAVVERLEDDDWPLVRAAAARTLGALGPRARVDEALADALGDSSPFVRAPVLQALGQRGARQHAEAVRERLDDRDEPLEVRVAAASALAAMCDQGAADLLTKYATRLADGSLPSDGRMLGSASLAALGKLHPPDLNERLRPLFGEGVATVVQQAARAALALPSQCGR